MAKAHPITTPYPPHIVNAAEFVALREAFLGGSMLLPFDEVVVETARVVVAGHPATGAKRIELILDDEDGEQTVLRFDLRVASLISALMSNTLLDTNAESLAQAMDDVHAQGHRHQS